MPGSVANLPTFLSRVAGGRRRAALAGLLVIYLVLASVYSLSTPLFEAPDAYYHFAVIEYLARTGSFPPDTSTQAHPWRQMVFHAPLYYQLGALLISGIDTADFPAHYPLNPHAQIGEPDATNNVNFVAHTGDPWTETGLAVRVVRLLSIALGAVTLLGVYALTRFVLPRAPRAALFAVLVVMLNPQFLFMSGVVSNDNLITALSTVCLALLVWIVRHGLNGRVFAILAVLLALNSLAKASGIILYPVAVLAILWVCWRSRFPVRRVALYALVGLLIWLLIAGGWYVHNWLSYGDPTASTMVARATGLRGSGPMDTIGELRGLYFSFWGLFGWFNLIAPQVFYLWTAILMLAGLGGALVMIRRLRPTTDDRIVAGLLAIYALIFVVSWWQFNRLVPAGQGRLWFPLLGPLACLLGWGLSRWRWRWVPALLLGGMALAAVAFPLVRIAPAYRPPSQILAEDWQPPANAVPVDLRETWMPDPCVTLWVSSPEVDAVARTITLSMDWQTHCLMTGYWSVFVHLSDWEHEVCGESDEPHIFAQFDSMPEGGNLPLPAFLPGHVVQDVAVLIVPENLDLSRIWHLDVGLYDAGGGTFVRTAVSLAENGGTANGISIRQCAPDAIRVPVNLSDLK